jgi:hypothetical protein
VAKRRYILKLFPTVGIAKLSAMKIEVAIFL